MISDATLGTKGNFSYNFGINNCPDIPWNDTAMTDAESVVLLLDRGEQIGGKQGSLHNATAPSGAMTSTHSNKSQCKKVPPRMDLIGSSCFFHLPSFPLQHITLTFTPILTM